MIEMVRIQVLNDNYVWLVHEPDSQEPWASMPNVESW